MRGRRPRAVPLKPAKLGADTLQMIADVRESPNRPRWYESVDAVVRDAVARLAAENGIPLRSQRYTEKESRPAGRGRS